MQLTKYQRAAIITITATIILIFVGGLVRAAGAGLGCPDWPHCFGQWIPPLRAEDLPPGYDASKFNVWQTWLEYMNRLLGATVGILIFWTLIRSWPLRKIKPVVFWGTLAAFFLVGFQGWLGGVVVKSELEEWIITAHMLTALLILSLLVFTAFLGSAEKFDSILNKTTKRLLSLTGSILFFIAIIQIVIGTQVRERIDIVSRGTTELLRTEWLSKVGSIDYAHRAFSLLVLAMTALLFLQINKYQVQGTIAHVGKWLVNLVILQIVFGIGLAYFGMPAPLQVFHLLTAFVFYCAIFFFLLLLAKSRE